MPFQLYIGFSLGHFTYARRMATGWQVVNLASRQGMEYVDVRGFHDSPRRRPMPLLFMLSPSEASTGLMASAAPPNLIDGAHGNFRGHLPDNKDSRGPSR